MSKASNIRIALKNELTSGLDDKQIAELCDTTVTNVKMVKLRMNNATSRDRLKRLEFAVEKMQDAIRKLEMRNAL